MITKCLFLNTKWAISGLKKYSGESCTEQYVFEFVDFNRVIGIYSRPTLVAMVTSLSIINAINDDTTEECRSL